MKWSDELTQTKGGEGYRRDTGDAREDGNMIMDERKARRIKQETQAMTQPKVL